MNIPKLPSSPGCYMFKNHSDKIIYVGKAKNIKKRAGSYFSKEVDEKTSAMLSKAVSVDFIATDTETEAFILENNLIKKFQPKYNIVLKDSKRYAYLKVTSEDFPRVVTARKVTDGRYFGPFVSGQAREDVKQVVIKAFKIRTCKKMPKKECLRYHIGLCDAPCTGKISKKGYAEKVKDAVMVLKGKNKELLLHLEKKMKTLSSSQDFEKALEVRDQISALQWLDEKQKFERNKKYDEDIINFAVKKGRVYLLVFNSKKGILENKQSFVFDYKQGFLEEFLMQYYDENPLPKEVILPCIDASFRKVLDTEFIIPKIGEKKKLLDVAMKNIELMFFSQEDSLKDLALKLKLPSLPEVIECFDISHLSGTSTVGSMVRFLNGIADKSGYRRFKIKTVDGIDDVSAIREVVFRRYRGLKDEKQKMPDLVIVDGGRGQLNAALSALKELRLKIPVISIAKKDEEVFFPGISFSVKFSKKTDALRLIQRIRDEAHRFAISYNRLLRKKKVRE